MILGIGTDIVDIRRIVRWQYRSAHNLKRIFSEQELIDCQSDQGGFVPEKLATRFAAKEACFKAICQALIEQKQTPPHFLTLCKNVSVCYHHAHLPRLSIAWQNLNLPLPSTSNTVHISLSHERNYAVAFVVITL